MIAAMSVLVTHYFTPPPPTYNRATRQDSVALNDDRENASRCIPRTNVTGNDTDREWKLRANHADTKACATHITHTKQHSVQP